MDFSRLMEAAIQARNNSYAPYSRFSVGAALLCDDGTVFQGANIENASYSATICAERTALFKAVSEGKTRFSAMAIAGGPYGSPPEGPCPPCGICLQVMAEFCPAEDFRLVLGASPEDYKTYTLKELLPLSFGAANMK